MTDVKRWKLKGFLPGVEGECKAVLRPTVVLEDDYDTALTQVAALREELEKAVDLAGVNLDALVAAEQLNAELVELLRRSSPGDGQDFKQWWNERATLLLSCLKPTESGASE